MYLLIYEISSFIFLVVRVTDFHLTIKYTVAKNDALILISSWLHPETLNCDLDLKFAIYHKVTSGLVEFHSELKLPMEFMLHLWKPGKI